MLVPYAQGIFGIYLPSYKNLQHAINGLLMIKFVKGDFEKFSLYNQYLAMILIFFYYSVVFFVLHAFFHKVQ